MKFGEKYKYEIAETFEEGKKDPGDIKIKKSGITAEFTLNDIDRDRQLLTRQKEEIEAMMQVEAAKMANIDRTNPEIGKMTESLRQVIYIYQRAFAACTVGKEKVAHINDMLEEYKNEMMDIAFQTGILTTNGSGTEDGKAAPEGSSTEGGK